MRVVMLVNGYYPRIGGAERVLTALAPVLRRAGADVHIVTRRFPGLAAFEKVDGVPVYRMPIPGPKALASCSYTLSALRQIRSLRPDVIHAHDLFATATTAALAKQRWGIPVVTTIHRSGPLGDIYRLQNKMLGKRRWSIFAKHTDAFVVISSEIDRELAELGIPAESRVTVSNGVDIERFSPVDSSRKQQIRQTLSLTEGPVVIFVGRLAAEKRVNLLLASWPNVLQRFPDAQLVVLGEGPEKGALRYNAPANVRFVGAVHNVEPYLQASDLFVLPSAAEGLSVAALEAQAAGVPTLMTAVGGAADMIEHAHNGWLVPSNDVFALCNALLTLLKDPALRERMALAGRARVVEHYSLSRVGTHLMSLYSTLRTDETSDLNAKVTP